MYNKWKSDIEVNTISQYYLNIPHFGTKKTYAMNNISSFPLEDVMKIYIYIGQRVISKFVKRNSEKMLH